MVPLLQRSVNGLTSHRVLSIFTLKGQEPVVPLGVKKARASKVPLHPFGQVLGRDLMQAAGTCIALKHLLRRYTAE